MTKKMKEQPTDGGLQVLLTSSDIDPQLASLFQASSTLTKRKRNDRNPSSPQHLNGTTSHRVGTSASSRKRVKSSDEKGANEDNSNGLLPSRRKGRGSEDVMDDLESKYLGRLENAQQQHGISHTKSMNIDGSANNEEVGAAGRPANVNTSDESQQLSEDETVESDSLEEQTVNSDVRLNARAEATEDEKATRTVFLGNVSTDAITSKSSKKELLKHLASFLSELQPEDDLHTVESIRFRSTAYGTTLSKKAAYVTQDLELATTRSTNAYAVYSTTVAAGEAVKRLNGTVVLNRHLRVDKVEHPAKIEPRRCVFVGNLGFVDDESNIRAANEAAAAEKGKTPSKPTRPKKPIVAADSEEGLWRYFGTVGKVVNVRVIRDAKTRVGKGFAYVQFEDENAVEAALLHDGKSFPPELPRKLRVMRARTMGGKHGTSGSKAGKNVGPRSKITARSRQGKPDGKVDRKTPVFEGKRAERTGGAAGKDKKARRTIKRTVGPKKQNYGSGQRKRKPKK